MTDLIQLDGAQGEGGGQVLRTALALSMVTGQPFRIENIRAGRPKPGLMRQHLTAVRAACAVCGGEADGASTGSSVLTFRPGPIRPGDYEFAVGTAGSTTLVLQTVLPALMTTAGPSTILLTGGTHNTHAPTVDFLTTTFLPALARFGPKVDATLERHGFYPAGGGRVRFRVDPAPALQPVELTERGDAATPSATAVIAGLDPQIALRELEILRDRLGWDESQTRVHQLPDTHGPGNVLTASLPFASVTEHITGFGEKGVSAERIARQVADSVRRHLRTDAPVGEHLADQLMIPMALAGSGCFRTGRPSGHTTTNAETIGRFLPVRFRRIEESGGVTRMEIVGRQSPQPGEIHTVGHTS